MTDFCGSWLLTAWPSCIFTASFRLDVTYLKLVLLPSSTGLEWISFLHLYWEALGKAMVSVIEIK